MAVAARPEVQRVSSVEPGAVAVGGWLAEPEGGGFEDAVGDVAELGAAGQFELLPGFDVDAQLVVEGFEAGVFGDGRGGQGRGLLEALTAG